MLNENQARNRLMYFEFSLPEINCTHIKWPLQWYAYICVLEIENNTVINVYLKCHKSSTNRYLETEKDAEVPCGTIIETVKYFFVL